MASGAVCPFCNATIEPEFPLCSSCGALLVGASVGVTHFDSTAGLLPFVGRTDEMESIRRAAETALAGSKQILWISGRPGVGKTRLLSEAVSTLLSQFHVTRSVCSSHGQYVPFRAFADLFRKAADIRLNDSVENNLKQIQKRLVVPEGFEVQHWDQRLVELLGWQLGNGQGIPATERRRQTILSAKTALLGLARTRPTCLILEDIQWMDASSWELLDGILNDFEDLPLLICLTSREPWQPARELPHECLTKIVLQPLDSEQTSDLLGAIFASHTLPDFMLDSLKKDQEWTPLYIDQLVRKLISQNIVKEGKDDWMQETPLDDELIPRELVNLIQSRIAGLGEGIRQILEVGAVIGAPFTSDLLERLQICSEGLREKVAMLEAMGFLARTDQEEDLHYVLNHAVTQEVVYNSLMQDHRKAMHARVLQTLLSLYGDDSEAHYEMMAYHAYEANLPDVALRYLTKCARKARDQYANREALEFYGQILSLLVQSPRLREHTDQIVDFLLKQAEVHRYIGEMEEAKADLEQAQQAAQRTKNGARQAQVEMAGALLALSVGASREAGEHLNKAGMLLEPVDEPRLKMELANLQGIHAWRAGRLDDAEGLYHGVIEIGDTLSDLTYVANAYNNLGLIAYSKGDLHRAFELHSKALKVRQQMDDLWGQAASHNNIGIVFENNNHEDSAEREYLQALNLARTTGFREVETAALANLGQCAENKGLFPQSLEYNSRSLDLATRLGDRRSQAIALDNLGNTHYLCGLFSEAQDKHGAALRLAESLDDGDICCRALLGLCFDLINGGKTDEAESLCDRAEQIVVRLGFNETRPRLYRARAELLLARGDIPGAQDEASKAMRSAQEMHLRAEETRATVLWNRLRQDKSGNGK